MRSRNLLLLLLIALMSLALPATVSVFSACDGAVLQADGPMPIPPIPDPPQAA